MKKYIWLAVPALLLLAAACNKSPESTTQRTSQGQQVNNQQGNTATTTVLGFSMEPTLKGDTVIYIDKNTTDFQRGDIILFQYPTWGDQLNTKRIIGLPGEQVEIKDNAVFINGQKLSEPYLGSNVQTISKNGKVTLAADEYFVMGDNRTSSASDSRILGAIKKSWIKAKYIGVAEPPRTNY